VVVVLVAVVVVLVDVKVLVEGLVDVVGDSHRSGFAGSELEQRNYSNLYSLMWFLLWSL
jgi:hypothetical protein